MTTNTQYVDGFVLPLPKDKISDYQRLAELASEVWIEHGALEYRECVGDALEAENMVPFPKLANAGPDETVIFAWIVYESKAHRDAVNAKVMADPRLAEFCGANDKVPFDPARMSWGGFRTIVKA
jgi:uncharacterized protein YbaA (DUF1428 family)